MRLLFIWYWQWNELSGGTPSYQTISPLDPVGTVDLKIQGLWIESFAVLNVCGVSTNKSIINLKTLLNL
jgi:hypothetical protein